MENTPKRFIYAANGLAVHHGGEQVATAKTHSMAKRIAFALNRYRDEYRRKPKAEENMTTAGEAAKWTEAQWAQYRKGERVDAQKEKTK